MSETRETLSIVIPACNEQGNIRRIAGAIRRIMADAGIDAAIYFVDDGSEDGTWGEILSAAGEWDRVRGVRFSRRFGKEAAIFAGLEAARGACCAVMDCDMQHPPEMLVEMYRLWESGYEVVEGVKEDRGRENLLYKAMSALFYKLMSSAAQMDLSRASDFKLLDRKAVDALVSLPERGTFFRALSGWVGYKSTAVSYHVGERHAGKSKWGAAGLVKYALRSITSFTTKPLYLVTGMGLLFLVLAAVLAVKCIADYAARRALGGFTTVILVELIIGAIVMISLGIIGGYIARIYEEVKGRHRYIISSTVGLDEKEQES